MEKTHELSIGKAFLWILAYFGVMLSYTAVDMWIWRKMDTPAGHWLNLLTMAVFSGIFIWILYVRTSFRCKLLDNLSLKNILLAVLCAAAFFLLLDKGLDPFFESLFPASEEIYRESLMELAESPVTSFLHVCILAPVIEETLIRGFVLQGLQKTSGTMAALLVSTLLFALLHFNMVQTLSAVVSGLILGLLFLKTNSLLSCIIAHCGYNIISYFVVLVPFINK